MTHKNPMPLETGITVSVRDLYLSSTQAFHEVGLDWTIQKPELNKLRLHVIQ